MPILRRHDQLVVPVGLHVGGYGLRDRVASRHREGTALAERRVNIDDNERAGHVSSMNVAVFARIAHGDFSWRAWRIPQQARQFPLPRKRARQYC